MNATPPLQVKGPIRSAIALSIKELLWGCAVRFTPSKRPIGIYASRRSGSSLLMEVICVNPGLLFSDQPFGLYTASPANVNRLPIFPSGQIAFPDADEELMLQDYVQGLLSGRVRANYPWKFWRSEFHFRNDRICLKITDAKSIIDWIAERFDLHTVVLTRHPIAQALSTVHLGWYPTGKGLLRNQGYVEHWLDDDLEAYSWDLYRGGSDLERRVLDWALENLPMLRRLVSHPDWLYVSYEDLVMRTKQVVQFLSERLELPARSKMIARAGRPSRSTRRESTSERRQLIARGDRQQLVGSWQSQVDNDQVKACFRILDRFRIDLYRPDSLFPAPGPVQRPESAESPAHASEP